MTGGSATEHHNLFRVLDKGYDDALLPVVSAFLGRRDPRNKAIVLHLMDSHAAYLDRYPPMDEPAGLDREQTEVLRYHRANDHTLTLLSKIAALLDSPSRARIRDLRIRSRRKSARGS